MVFLLKQTMSLEISVNTHFLKSQFCIRRYLKITHIISACSYNLGQIHGLLFRPHQLELLFSEKHSWNSLPLAQPKLTPFAWNKNTSTHLILWSISVSFSISWSKRSLAGSVSEVSLGEGVRGMGRVLTRRQPMRSRRGWRAKRVSVIECKKKIRNFLAIQIVQENLPSRLIPHSRHFL